MHPSALEFGDLFFKSYFSDDKHIVIMDVGAQDVNGSLRDVSPSAASYVGIDFVAGCGVDVILDDPYHLPMEDGSADVVVCSSVFEHSQFFWLLYLEVLRILKPNGLFYLNAPSNGYIHRYPVDCWRFYPDAGHALVAWGERNGYTPALLESFIGDKNCQSMHADAWNDYVAVFIKDAACRAEYPDRILHALPSYAHGYCDDGTIDDKFNELTDDFVVILDREARNQELAAALITQQQEFSAALSERQQAFDTALSERQQAFDKALSDQQQASAVLSMQQQQENRALLAELAAQHDRLSAEQRAWQESERAFQARQEDLASRMAVMSAQLSAGQTALEQQATHARALQEQIGQLKSTWSWRLTMPLRKLYTLLRG